jgi:hypothetical protein
MTNPCGRPRRSYDRWTNIEPSTPPLDVRWLDIAQSRPPSAIERKPAPMITPHVVLLVFIIIAIGDAGHY